MFAPNAVADRVTAVIHASVAALPKQSRGSSAAQLNDARTKGLAGTMTKWSKAGSLSEADFAAAYFDRDGGDLAVKLLRDAAETAASARSHADLAKASVQLASAQEKIGSDHWRAFVGGAVNRAASFGEFARAAGNRATNAKPETNGGAPAPGRKGQTGKLPIDAPGEPKGPHLYNRFFDAVHKRISDLAKELGVNEDWILGHSAHESNYLDNHNFPLNNAFGQTNAGGRNLSFPSVADSISMYRNDYGPQIRGAASAEDFVDRIQGRLNGRPVPAWRRYNSATSTYESDLLKVIRSIPRHKADWSERTEVGH